MTALKTGREIPAMPSGRKLEQYANCLPEAVAAGSPAQMMYFVRDAKQDIAGLAARLSSLEALLHDIASDCRSPTAHAGNALRQIGDKIERAMEGVSAGVASLEAERAKTVEALQTIAVGAVPRRRAYPWRADGEPSNYDCCEHFVPMYEDCGECIGNFAASSLASEKGQADALR